MRRYIVLFILTLMLIGAMWYAQQQLASLARQTGVPSPLVTQPSQTGQMHPQTLSGSNADNAEQVRASRQELDAKVAALKDRLKFSDTFLKEFPDIYQDLARFNTASKFLFIREVTSILDDGNYKYWDKATNQDIANLMDDILSDKEAELTTEQKEYIITMARGQFSIGDYYGGWYQGIPEATPCLLKLLSDKSDKVRWGVIMAFWEFDKKETAPEIAKFLNDPDFLPKRAVIMALARLDYKEAIPQILNLLKDKEGGIRGDAIEALYRLDAKDTITEIVKLVGDSETSVQYYVLRAIGQLGAKEYTPLLLDTVKNQGECGWIRGTAADALGELNAQEVIPDIIELLENPSWENKVTAIYTLEKLNAKQTIPLLRGYLTIGKDEPFILPFAIEALAEFGDTESIPVITSLLKETNSDSVQRAALTALGKLGAREAIPEIRKMLSNSDYSVRENAAEALGMLEDRESIPEIIKLIDRGTPGVLRAIVQLKAKEAAPEIAKKLVYKHVVMEGWGEGALALATLDAKEAIPEITKLLYTRACGDAAIALVELGAKHLVPQEAVPAIKSIVCWSKDGIYTQRARAALKALGVGD